MRRNELINLHWADVNMINKYLIVRNTESFTTKSKSERVIPLNQNSLDVLRNIHQEVIMFFSTAIHKKYTQIIFRNVLEILLVKLNIRDDRSFHSLRHTFASWLVQERCIHIRSKKLLGHSDIRVTQIYAHLTPDNLRSAVELLN